MYRNVYLKAGQSNMIGLANKGYVQQSADLAVRLYANLTTEAGRVDMATDNPSGGRDLAPIDCLGVSRSGPEIQFGRLLFKQFGPDHASTIVKFGMGGTGMRHWLYPSGLRLADRMVGFLNSVRADIESAGDKFVLRGLCWLQGESDTGSQEEAYKYPDNLNAIVGMARAFADNPELPVTVARTHIVVPQNRTRPLNTVRTAQRRFCESDKKAALVNLDDIEHATGGVHFTQAQYAKIGAREFNRLMSIS